MIRRRALAAGIEIKIGRNTFRATGITAYLDDRRLEIAQQMGAHESALTTGLCAPPQRRQRTSALNLPIMRLPRQFGITFQVVRHSFTIAKMEAESLRSDRISQA